MNPKYLYLALNIFSFLIPFIFSFHPKANFSKKWKFILPAIMITATIFIVWDGLFTRIGVWGFNEKYLSGIYIFNLPLEEVLFFFCIPYACLFTYFALNHLIEKDLLQPYEKFITGILITAMMLIGGLHIEQWYTSTTFIALALFLAFHTLKLRSHYMGRFYFAFLLLLLPFFLINGILTGSFIESPVVWYNDAETMGIRIGTIPVEDAFYAILLILMSVTIAEALESGMLAKKIAR